MNDNMKEDVLRVLLSEDEIREKVRELGGKITADYKNSNLMLVTVLKGAVVFLADLMRQIDVPAEIDFMVVSSYGSGVKSSGVVKIVKDLDVPLAGKDILIVEDILDSGLTLSYIKECLASGIPKVFASPRCWINPAAARLTCRRITSASRCRTSSSSATGWITMKNTATCPLWGC